MLDKAEKLEKRYQEVEQLLADPQVSSDQNQCQKLGKELSDLSQVVQVLRAYRATIAQIKDTQKLLQEKHDRDFEELAKAELMDLAQK